MTNVRQFDQEFLVAPIARDQAAFRSMFRDIKSELDRLQCDPTSRVCGAALMERLCHLRERLKFFFEDEERTWSQLDERELDSATERWVLMVARRHRESEDRLASVVDELGRCLSTEARIPPACEASVREVLTELMRLELSDDRLLQRAIFEDLDGV